MGGKLDNTCYLLVEEVFKQRVEKLVARVVPNEDVGLIEVGVW